MDKSAITFTCGREWWLERVTMKGRERYPKLIRVGKLGKERVYVPERACRMVDNGCELCCSKCDGRIEYDYEPNYCPSCGARVVTGDDA